MDIKMIDPAKVDVNGGYMCLWSHWRPDPEQPNPDMPGLKQHTLTYLPHSTDEPCLCGSGKAFKACCQQEQYWWPICPDPEFEDYSLLAPQSLTFRNIDGVALRERLMDDDRLNCTDDSPMQGFWSYWGDTIVETPGLGIVGFGDLELKHDHTLLVTALSDVRRQVILDFLKEVAGDLLGRPVHKYDSLEVFDKQTWKSRTLPKLQWLKRTVGNHN
jgi:hypothetical protein